MKIELILEIGTDRDIIQSHDEIFNLINSIGEIQEIEFDRMLHTNPLALTELESKNRK